MGKKIKIDRDQLYQLYIVENKSGGEVARILGVSKDTVFTNAKIHKFNKAESIKVNVDKDVLYQLFINENKTVGEISDILNIPYSTVEKKLGKFSIKKPRELAQECKERGMLAEYGVKNAGKSKVIRDRTKATCQIRFSTDYALQNKDVIAKKLDTCEKRSGYKYNLQIPAVREQIKETCNVVYGGVCPACSIEVREKMGDTCESRFGTRNAMQNDKVKEKLKRILIDRGYIKEIECQTIHELSDNYGISITSLNNIYNDNDFSDEEFINYVKNLKNFGMNRLECDFGIATNMERFNKKPTQLDRIYRPDFILMENMYINSDGLYWHSESCKRITRNYHFNMRQHFEEKGLRLLQFHEDEIRDRLSIIKSMLSNLLGKSNKIYARKTVIKEVNQKEATLFLNNNHIMGDSSSRHVGLFYENQLVCLFSYKIYKDKLDVTRFCSLINHTVVGGFSKLLAHVEKLHPNLPVHYWVDLRYGTGNFLLSQGFVIPKKDTLSWKWTDYENTYNRRKCRANMDERKLTEREHANELKLYKIYDAGQRLYVKKAN